MANLTAIFVLPFKEGNNMQIKAIEWKRYEEAEVGYVGGIKRFALTYSFNTPPWRLITLLGGITPQFSKSEEESKNLAQAILQKHVSSLIK